MFNFDQYSTSHHKLNIMSQTPADAASKKEAETWFKTEAWKNGLPLNADPSTNKLEFYRQYHANKTGWDHAFSFLKGQDLENIRPGKYQIDGENVYASVTEGPNMDFDKTAWESHRKYNDIQYVIKGKETIGIASPYTAEITVDYNEAQDITFYNVEESALFSFDPDFFFIFFPQDLHRPGIKVKDSDTIKKIVIKIKTAI